MVKLPKDFWRKVCKGFNLVGHWHELLELREYVEAPWHVLVGGTVLAVVLRVFGMWAQLNAFVSSFHPALNDLVNMQSFFLGMVGCASLVMLARNMFMSRAKSSKASEWYIVYVWRYIKTIMIITAPFVPFLILLSLLMFFVGFMPELRVPKTALDFFSAIVFLSGYAMLFAAQTVLAMYPAAFLLQGHPVREAVIRGLRLFTAQWIQPVCLVVLFGGLPLVAGIVFMAIKPRLPLFLQGAMAADLGAYLVMLSGLVYATLFFAYHKRVSKVPGNR